MTWHCDRPELLAAQGDRLPFREHLVVFRKIGRAFLASGVFHEIPIRSGHVYLRAVVLLQIHRAAEVIGVAVRVTSTILTFGSRPSFFNPAIRTGSTSFEYPASISAMPSKS